MKKGLVILLLFLAGCGVSKMMPAPEQLPAMQQKVPGITMERAAQGYTAYKQTCAGCHRLYAASGHTAAQWDGILVKMFPKAKVHDDGTKSLIADYLHALSK